MRLLVATHSFDHDGAAMILSELIAHLRDRHGWPIDVLHSGRGPLCAALAARGVRFLEHARGADYDLALVNTAIGYEMVAKLARAMPVVFWVHEGRTYLHTTRATPRELTEAFASAIRIVFPVQWQSSRAFASFLSEASARRVRILPCGIRDLTTRAVTAQPRRGRSVRIAFVGSIHARKRVGDLAHAIRMLPGLDLECIAIGSTSQIDKLDAADHEAMLGQPDRFRLLGVLDGDELAAWLASADFFCHPSGDEAQALSALEAARFGLPPAISNLPGYDGIWAHGVNCLMHEPGDRRHLAWNLRVLAEDSELRGTLGRAARKTAQRFEMQSFLDRMRALLEEAREDARPHDRASDGPRSTQGVPGPPSSAGALERPGPPERSEQRLRGLLERDPRNAAAIAELANLLAAQGRRDEALALFDDALCIEPGLAHVHHNRALTLCELGRHAEALAGFEAALQIEPRFVGAHGSQADALRALGRLDEAVDAYDRAIALDPDCAPAHNGRGIALRLLQRPSLALASFERAVAARAGYVDAQANLGNTLLALGRPGDALQVYAQAVAREPEHAESQFGAGLAHLVQGDLGRGFALYEWRWRRPKNPAPRHTEVPLWLGSESIAGRTLLLHAEQGLGDTLQLCRYAPIAVAAGARVLLEVQAPLVELLSSLSGVERVHRLGARIRRPDLQCPMCSLPLAFGTTLSDVPAQLPYLRADAGRVERWERALGARTRPRIGMVWSGARGQTNDAVRSLPYALLRPLLDIDADFVCLQNEIRAPDLEALAADGRVRCFTADLTDFAETAALVSCLDLVVSVDTSVAHLAGALGAPLWILLPYAPDWRWMRSRPDTPWYPGARLFRQPEPGDWQGVVASVASELASLPAAGTAHAYAR